MPRRPSRPRPAVRRQAAACLLVLALTACAAPAHSGRDRDPGERWADATGDELHSLALSGGPEWRVAGEPTPGAPPREPPQEAGEEPPRRLRTWELPAIQVVGEPLPELREEELIGPYKQPRWTAHRRFPTTRIYVLPEGKFDVEYWMRVDEPRSGDTRIRHYYEFEWGLGNRLQLDVYLVSDDTGEWDFTGIDQEQVELRWALADWGELWGNPTLYFEVINRHHDPEKVEAKLLVGDQLAPGWHWGSNLVWEEETGGEREREIELTYGISRTIVDETFSVGAEAKAAAVTVQGDRHDPSYEFFLGPSFQYRPNERCHIDFAPLVGLGGHSGKAQIWLIVGWEF